MKNLTLLLSLFFLCQPTLWAGYQITGTIRAEQGQSTEGINVVLIEQNPNKPPQGPVAMSQVGAQGKYSLEVDEADLTSMYVVGTRLGQTRVASKPFKIDKPKVTVDVLIPKSSSAVVGDLPGPFVFEGTLQGEAGFDPAGSNVQVIELTMKNPDGKVVGHSLADSAGAFKVVLSQGDSRSLYLLAASKGVRIAGNEPTPLHKGVKLPPFRLVFLPKSVDPSHLAVKKDLFYFELMPDKVQVSEILLLENQFSGTLDLRKTPFAKTLPEGAEKFRLVRASGTTEGVQIGKKVMISTALNPGRNQIFFTYDLPPSSYGEALTSGLLPRTEEVELVRTSAGFEISFLGTLAKEVVESQKGHGQEMYFSKHSLVPSGLDKIKFTVDVSLIPQKRLFYPATLLMVLLLSGLFWYVKVKPDRS